MPDFGDVLASYALTGWLCLANIALLTTSMAGLFCGKVFWFHPIPQDRVDRTPEGRAANEAWFRRRIPVLALALALGWLPGVAASLVMGPGNSQVDSVILGVTIFAGVVYLWRSVRRFDRDGAERNMRRYLAEGQARIDSAP